MRVTFVLPVLESGGGARIVAGHARRLMERGHDVTMVVPVPEKLSLRQKTKIALGREAGPSDPAKSHYVQAGLPILYVPRDKLSYPPSYPDADVIVATYWITAEWIVSLPPSKGAKVHFLQGYEALPGIPKDRVDAVWNLPIAKIAVARWLVHLARSRFAVSNIALVPNSIDHDRFRPDGRSERKRTVGFLYSGALSKDIATSLATVEQIRSRMPETNFVSFGTSRPDAGFPDFVDFYHLPEQEQIARIYRSCDVWLSTSLIEGFNLPPLEAMACGCPAVCSKTGRPLEIIKNDVNGYLVEPRDVAGFASAALKVLSLSDEDWRKMSYHAIETVAHPSWDESSRLFEAALISIIQNDRTD